MRFVRKPKPYTAGRGAARFPKRRFFWSGYARRQPWRGASAIKRRGDTSQVGPAFGPPPPQRLLNALAGLGAALCLLIFGSMVLNQVTREAQFQSVAAHLTGTP